MKGIQACSNKWPGSLQRGDIHKKCKNEVWHLKIYFFTTIKITKAEFDMEVLCLRTKHVGKNHGPKGLDGANGNKMHI
jgi:hypothetical protein